MGVFVTKPTQPYNDCFHHRFFPQAALRYFMLTKKKSEVQREVFAISRKRETFLLYTQLQVKKDTSDPLE